MDFKTKLRDKVVKQLLDIFKPFQIAALDVNDVGNDNGRLFLRIRCQENATNEYLFIPLPEQIQDDLAAFLANGLPLYEKRSRALFPNRFGHRQTTRNLRYRHQRDYGIKREVIQLEKPVSTEGIQWFNLWNRAEVVYFAQSKSGLIKIGHSRCFSTRFQTLESEEGQMELLGLVGGNKAEELHILNQFKYLLARGTEWFHPARELFDFIDAVNNTGREALLSR